MSPISAKKFVGLLRLVMRSGLIEVIHKYAIPWYAKRKNEVAEHVRFQLRNEVATKLEEALAPIRWVRKEENFPDPEILEVTHVRALVTGGSYLLMLTLADEDGEIGEMPLHAFLQMFEPVDEIRPQEYHS